MYTAPLIALALTATLHTPPAVHHGEPISEGVCRNTPTRTCFNGGVQNPDETAEQYWQWLQNWNRQREREAHDHWCVVHVGVCRRP